MIDFFKNDILKSQKRKGDRKMSIISITKYARKKGFAKVKKTNVRINGYRAYVPFMKRHNGFKGFPRFILVKGNHIFMSDETNWAQIYDILYPQSLSCGV